MKAALDFPDLNLLVYHPALKNVQEVLPSARSAFRTSSEVPWVGDLRRWKKKHPEVSSVCIRLGSTSGMTATTLPLLCAHILGMILEAFGEDHVLWGTDAIWRGSPQWQIEAMPRFEIPEELMKRFGCGPLTTGIKRKILGLNGARVYGLDPEAGLRPMPAGCVDRLRKLCRESGMALPGNTQHGWIVA